MVKKQLLYQLSCDVRRVQLVGRYSGDQCQGIYIIIAKGTEYLL